MIKACIVGFGAIGPIHAEALSILNKVQLYAVCDIIKERADECAKKYNCKAYYDFDECLKDKDIDYIHICTPHYLHFEMITKALNSGKRVVVEKPAVMKKSELDILFDKYDVTKIFPIVQNRTNACVEKICELMKSGEMGKLAGIKGYLTWRRDEEYYKSDAWRGTKEYEGGGVLINQAIHMLDLMSYFAGEAESVVAHADNVSLKGVIDVEDTVTAYIKYKNNACGCFYATNAYAVNSSFQLEIDFEKKNLLYIHGSLYAGGEIICSDSNEFRGKSYWGNGHARVFKELYEEGSEFCLKDIEETMKTMFAIYLSAENKTTSA